MFQMQNFDTDIYTYVPIEHLCYHIPVPLITINTIVFNIKTCLKHKSW